jgi:hypothetical protein
VVTVTQSLIVISSLCGILFFIYVNFFSYVRLQLDKRRMVREAQEEEDMAARAANERNLPALPAFNREAAEESMYYLYQEQVRRLIDAKIDIMRSMAETQNRIALVQAEVVRLNTEKELCLVQNGGGADQLCLPANEDGEAAPKSAEVVVFQPKDKAMSSLLAQQQAMRDEAERRLMDIDAQIRSLPGASLDRWVAAQTGGHALANAAD